MFLKRSATYWLSIQLSLDKFHAKAQEVFWPIESTKLDPPAMVKQQEQTIVYAASIRQVMLLH